MLPHVSARFPHPSTRVGRVKRRVLSFHQDPDPPSHTHFSASRRESTADLLIFSVNQYNLLFCKHGSLLFCMGDPEICPTFRLPWPTYTVFIILATFCFRHSSLIPIGLGYHHYTLHAAVSPSLDGFQCRKIRWNVLVL